MYLYTVNSLSLISEPDSVQCQRNSVSEVEVQFVCQVKYKGWIQPMIQWQVKNKDEPINGTLHVTDGTLQSRLTVPVADLALWPTECLIIFPRQSCNQPRPAYTRTQECPSDDSKYDCFSIAISVKLIDTLLQILYNYSYVSLSINGIKGV